MSPSGVSAGIFVHWLLKWKLATGVQLLDGWIVGLLTCLLAICESQMHGGNHQMFSPFFCWLLTCSKLCGFIWSDPTYKYTAHSCNWWRMMSQLLLCSMPTGHNFSSCSLLDDDVVKPVGHAYWTDAMLAAAWCFCRLYTGCGQQHSMHQLQQQPWQKCCIAGMCSVFGGVFMLYTHTRRVFMLYIHK